MTFSCVYCIKSKIKPEKWYIGSAVDYKKRKNLHLYTLKLKTHPNKILQHHCNKYGIDDLQFEILEIISVKSELVKREQYYMDLHNPSFNICRYAANTLGRKTTPEAAAKRKETLSKKPPLRTMLGKHHSEETKQKMREYAKNRNPEHNKKIAAAMTGKKSVLKGRKRSPEIIEKTAKFHRGKIVSKKTREKLSRSRRLYFKRIKKLKKTKQLYLFTK